MFGAELRKARELVGVTQEELAFRAKVHRTYISLLERDKKSPTLTVLFKLCDALGVSASRLIANIEKPRKPRPDRPRRP